MVVDHFLVRKIGCESAGRSVPIFSLPPSFRAVWLVESSTSDRSCKSSDPLSCDLVGVPSFASVVLPKRPPKGLKKKELGLLVGVGEVGTLALVGMGGTGDEGGQEAG